jgi:hypothetical protein
VCQEADLQLKIAVEKQSIQLLEIAQVCHFSPPSLFSFAFSHNLFAYQGKRLPFARSARRRKNIVNPLAALMPTGTLLYPSFSLSKIRNRVLTLYFCLFVFFCTRNGYRRQL